MQGILTRRRARREKHGRSRAGRRLRFEGLESRHMMSAGGLGSRDLDALRSAKPAHWNGVAFAFTVSPQLAGAFPLLKNNFEAAGKILNGLLAGKGQIEVSVQVSTSYVGAYAELPHWIATTAYGVYEPGTIHEARTGYDPNGAAPDIVIKIHPDYLKNDVWFDPSGVTRSAPVAAGKNDCVSLALHELLHGLGFSGVRDANPTNNWGKLPPGMKSSFDALTDWDPGYNQETLSFIGANAVQANGGPVPLNTFPKQGGNFYHLGQVGGHPPIGLGDAGTISNEANAYWLGQELMGADPRAGLGTRRSPSAVDLAILRDLGWSAASWETPQLLFQKPILRVGPPVGPLPPVRRNPVAVRGNLTGTAAPTSAARTTTTLSQTHALLQTQPVAIPRTVAIVRTVAGQARTLTLRG